MKFKIDSLRFEVKRCLVKLTLSSKTYTGYLELQKLKLPLRCRNILLILRFGHQTPSIYQLDFNYLLTYTKGRDTFKIHPFKIHPVKFEKGLPIEGKG